LACPLSVLGPVTCFCGSFFRSVSSLEFAGHPILFPPHSNSTDEPVLVLSLFLLLTQASSFCLSRFFLSHSARLSSVGLCGSFTRTQAHRLSALLRILSPHVRQGVFLSTVFKPSPSDSCLFFLPLFLSRPFFGCLWPPRPSKVFHALAPLRFRSRHFFVPSSLKKEHRPSPLN